MMSNDDNESASDYKNASSGMDKKFYFIDLVIIDSNKGISMFRMQKFYCFINIVFLR